MGSDLDLVGTLEAAQILEVDRTTITRRVARGEMAVAVRLPGKNGSLLFDRAELDALAAEKAS